jgi:ABC-type uncharacterized transport system substrate-binding protein
MLRRNHIVFVASVVFILAAVPLCAAADGKQIPTVLIVQSYAKGQGCGGRLEVGLMEEFKSLGYEDGKNIHFHHFYMDTQTKYMSPQQRKMRGALAIKKAQELKPTVLVIFDDTAFRFVALPLAKTSHQIVFGGVNVAPERYNAETEFMKSREKPGYNITGVTEESTSDYATQMMKQIIPSAKGMTIVSSDTTPFFRYIAEDIIEDIRRNPQNYPIEMKSAHFVKKYSELKKLYSGFNQDNNIDVIHYSSTGLVGDNGEGIKHEEIVRWILENSKKPTYVWMVDWVPMGFFGGAGVNLHLCGRQVATKVVRVLNGEKAGHIPIEKPKYHTIDINLARAQQLGIPIPSDLLLVADKVYTEMTLCPGYKYKSE